MIDNVGTFSVMGVKRLPYKIVGQVERAGYVDPFPGIPFGKMTATGWVTFSKEDRAQIVAEAAEKAERAAKKAAKIAAGWVPKERQKKAPKVKVERVYPKQPDAPDPSVIKAKFKADNEMKVREAADRLALIKAKGVYRSPADVAKELQILASEKASHVLKVQQAERMIADGDARTVEEIVSILVKQALAAKAAIKGK